MAGPHGTVTFVLTDLEGSTGQWEHDPAAMDRVLRMHDELMADTFAAGGGHVFSRAGDSFATAFASPTDAVAAAVDVQRGITSLDDALTLRARIGLHTGEAFERDGNYFGPVVNRAARLMAAAHGGQVLCSSPTAELIRSSLPDGVRLRPLGSHLLKDLLTPETVFQVDAPGLRTTFPPLHTLDAVRHNLPVQLTRLIGRDAEIATVTGELRRTRLVTLTGVGGCGKTRLALAAGAEVATTYADGVFFVPLATVTDERGLLASVIEALGIRLSSESAPDLARFLERLDMVVILDNCEHLLDEVSDLVDELLSRPAGVRVLATSREALGAASEHVFRLPSLPVEALDGAPNPALELPIERMRSAGAPLPDRHEHDVLVDICRRLDGIPLAIELAAAQLDQIGPRDLLDRLDDRFDLLVGGHGRRRQRQQTLQAVMEWSWELLSEDEQRALALLSVFGGTWSLENAELLAASFHETHMVRRVAALAGKSMVEAVFADDVARYRLLETVRLFAGSKLVEWGLAERARTAHAEMHLSIAVEITTDQAFLDLDVLARRASELTDVGAAIDWLIVRERWIDAARLVVSCGGCYSRGLSSSRCVAEVRRLEDLVDGVVRAQMLLAGAFAAVCTGEHQLTARWSGAALMLPDGEDPFSTGQAAFLVAGPLILTDPPAAEALLLRAHDAAGHGGTALLRGVVQMWLNMAHFCTPELDLPLAEEGDVAAFGGIRSLGWLIARQLGALSLAERGEHRAALELLEPSVPGTATGDVDDDFMYRIGVEALAGDPEAAVLLARASIGEIDRRSDVLWHAELVVMLGIAHARAGRFVDAVVHIEVGKRAPMVFPSFYALARRHGRAARSALDQTAVPEAIEHARRLTIEDLLDQEVRNRPLVGDRPIEELA